MFVFYLFAELLKKESVLVQKSIVENIINKFISFEKDKIKNYKETFKPKTVNYNNIDKLKELELIEQALETLPNSLQDYLYQIILVGLTKDETS
jgi:hypothetical protein